MSTGSKLILSVFSATIGSGFHYGFNTGPVSILLFQVLLPWHEIVYAQEHEQRPEWQINLLTTFISASFPIGGIIGGLLIAVFLQFFGRRISLMLSNGIALVGVFIMSFAWLIESFVVCFLGRLIMGVSAGLSTGIAPIYLVEIAPTEHRGVAGCVFYLIASVAMLVSMLFSGPSESGASLQFPYLFVVGLLPPIVQIILMVLCKETPRYLYITKDDEDEAEKALMWLRNDWEIDEEMEEMKTENQYLQSLDYAPNMACSEQHMRSPIIITSILMAGQQLSGIGVIFYYYGAKDLASTHHYMAIGFALINAVGAFSMMFLIERLGRKILLLISFAGMSIIMFLFIFAQLLEANSKIKDYVPATARTLICLYVLFFSIGAGPIPWFYTAELANYLARPVTSSFAVSLNWTACFMVAFFYNLFNCFMGHFALFFFATFNVVTLLFIIFTMRETQGLFPNDIVELFDD